MRINPFKTFRYLAAIFLLLPALLKGQTGCITNATIEVYPVQCNSFRNGAIKVKEIVGGIQPYYFSLDGATFSTRPAFDLLWPGTYTVSIRDSSGCEWAKSIEITEPPILEVRLSSDQDTITSGAFVELTADVNPPGTIIQSISWRPPSIFIGTPNLHQLVQIFVTSQIAVEIVDNNNCTARDQLLVEVRKPNIYAPNILAFNSNDDAYFTIFSDEYIRQINLLQVYNRYGGLLFERRDFLPNDPLLGWNGKFEGKKAPDGVYSWVAEILFLNGQIQKTAGTITLIN